MSDFPIKRVTRGWVGVKFPRKKHYVTLEWPLKVISHNMVPRILGQRLQSERRSLTGVEKACSRMAGEKEAL